MAEVDWNGTQKSKDYFITAYGSVKVKFDEIRVDDKLAKLVQIQNVEKVEVIEINQVKNGANPIEDEEVDSSS